MNGLSDKSLILLRRCLLSQNSDLAEVLDNTNAEYTIDLYNQLRNNVCNELLCNGLAENGEPTEYGIELERLIDEIGRLFL